jgi:thiosulfate/3-mercaptopyruvate sulfurtransferase
VSRHVDLEDPTSYPTNKYPQKRQFLQLMSRLGIDNNTTVVAYDDKPSVFASRMVFVMELYGHDVHKLKLLDGGITKWKADGRPVTTRASKARHAERYVAIGPDKSMLVSWSDVFRDVVQKQRPDVILYDARPLAEFNGSKIRTIRGGHIPGAINVVGVKAANNKDHTFKSIAAIRKAFTAAGITPDKTIYTYCHSSDRAAHAYVVLKNLLGYPKVKIYEGAWNEWGTMTALPAADETYK